MLPTAPPVSAAQSTPAACSRPAYAYWGGENLYVNLTSRCSSSCIFCLRESTWEIFGADLYLGEEEEPNPAEVIAALEEEMGTRHGGMPGLAGAAADGSPLGAAEKAAGAVDQPATRAAGGRRPREVVFTGLGEPTVRLDTLLEIVRWLGARGLPSRLDTNGHASLLHPGRAVAAELAAAGLDGVSVSLNASDAASYDEICRPSHRDAFGSVLDFVRDSLDAGLETTATMVGIPGLPVGPAAALAAELGAAFRVRPYLSPSRRR